MLVSEFVGCLEFLSLGGWLGGCDDQLLSVSAYVEGRLGVDLKQL